MAFDAKHHAEEIRTLIEQPYLLSRSLNEMTAKEIPSFLDRLTKTLDLIAMHCDDIVELENSKNE